MNVVLLCDVCIRIYRYFEYIRHTFGSIHSFPLSLSLLLIIIGFTRFWSTVCVIAYWFMMAIDEHANVVLSTDFIGVYRHFRWWWSYTKTIIVRSLFTFRCGFLSVFVCVLFNLKTLFRLHPFQIRSTPHTFLIIRLLTVVNESSLELTNVGVQCFKIRNQHLLHICVIVRFYQGKAEKKHMLSSAIAISANYSVSLWQNTTAMESKRIQYVCKSQQNDALIFNNIHFECYVWMLSA